MATDWKTHWFGRAPVNIVDGDRGKNYPKRSEFSPHGHCLFLNTSNVTETGFDFAECDFISQRRDNALRKGKLKRLDVVMTTRGTVGNTAFYDGTVPFEHVRINSGMVIFRPDQRRLHPRFLYFVLRSSSFKQQTISLTTGSAQPQFPIRDIRRVEIPIPPIAEQRAIAQILGSLDDKIHLNNKMNHTLEAIASAIFKSWFVDFDPVVAKADARQPYGMNPETAALFPAGFQESDFAPIPQGWTLKPLDQVAHYQNGLALQNYPPEGDGFLPVIKIRELRQGHSDSSSDRASPNIAESCILHDGDIVFSWSGSLLVDIWCGGQGALNQHLFKVTSQDYPKWFYYYWTRYHLAEFQDIADGKATTMGHIRRHHLTSAQTVVPSIECLERADRLMRPLLDTIVSNNLESRTLTAIRDALLPRLMSGELRVKQAQTLVEDAL